MSNGKLTLAMAVVAIAGAVFAVQAFSQEARPNAGGGGGAGGRGGGRFDPEQMRQAYMQRIKESLGATDEEWKVLAPRIEKVQSLSTQLRSGARMGMAGGRGQRGGGQEGAPQAGAQPQREQNAVEKASTALREALDNQNAAAEDIAKKLKALREAREKVKQELARAQDELRQILTARQEAQLVLMGMLD